MNDVALDAFSLTTDFSHFGEARVAYRYEGTGPPIAMVHGCPSSESTRT